jgi:hypothetical protein
MSDSENTPQAKVDNRFNESIAEDVENLQASFQSLQSLVTFSLALMLLFTVCLNLYIGTQMLIIREQEHRAEGTMNKFNTETGPAIAELWLKLNDFGNKHPDYKPVLPKYTPYFNQFFAEHKITVAGAKK